VKYLSKYLQPFLRNGKADPKINLELQGTLSGKKKSGKKVEGLTLVNFKLYYTSTVIKKV
jgi:hypothetical protein